MSAYHYRSTMATFVFCVRIIIGWPTWMPCFISTHIALTSTLLDNEKMPLAQSRDERLNTFVVPPFFGLSVLAKTSNNPSLTRFTLISCDNGRMFRMRTTGSICRNKLQQKVRSLAPRPIQRLHWYRLSPAPTLYDHTKSYTLPVHCYQLFSCIARSI